MNREACELLLRDGIVIGGTGAPRRNVDVAVDGDRISAVGRLDGTRAAREIDASGLVVSPGFIDAHTHDDRAVLSDTGMACEVSPGGDHRRRRQLRREPGAAHRTRAPAAPQPPRRRGLVPIPHLRGLLGGARRGAARGLEDAVHRMTGKPAAVFGLSGRGEVREGVFAGLVLFDPDAIIDTATFENPTRPAAGIRSVLVNGREVWAGGLPPRRPGSVPAGFSAVGRIEHVAD